MNSNSPFVGLLIYYFILTVTVLILEYFGLIIAGIKFGNFNQTIGTMLIIFSFFIIINWESCYINTITKGNCDNVSNVYLQSEDGAVYYLWSKLFTNVNIIRLFTYIITPFILSIIGVSMITQKINLFPF